MARLIALVVATTLACGGLARAQEQKPGLDLSADKLRWLETGELECLEARIQLGPWTLEARRARGRGGKLSLEDGVTLTVKGSPLKVSCLSATLRVNRGRAVVSTAAVQVVGLTRKGREAQIRGGRLSGVWEASKSNVTVFEAVVVSGEQVTEVGRVDLAGGSGELGGGLKLAEGKAPKPAPQEAQDATPVQRALIWLGAHQKPDGSWSSSNWRDLCGRGHALAPCSGSGHEAGDSRYDVGVTALAMLAFVRSGHTHTQGAHSTTVKRALGWLQKQQLADGALGFDLRHGESIYNHALATQALCELFGASKDPALRLYAKSSVAFVLAAQNPKLGWKYGIRSGRNDTSVTGFMVHALLAAQQAGLDVPESALQGARRWFLRATSREGAAGYESPGGGSAFLMQNEGKFDLLPVMTAVSLASRLRLGDSPKEPLVLAGATLLSASPPSWSSRRCSFYYWFYGTEAAQALGGDAWTAWRGKLRAALLENQRQGGCVDGSWDPVGEWCLAGGRVYATAINALSLSLAEK